VCSCGKVSRERRNNRADKEESAEVVEGKGSQTELATRTMEEKIKEEDNMEKGLVSSSKDLRSCGVARARLGPRSNVSCGYGIVCI